MKIREILALILIHAHDLKVSGACMEEIHNLLSTDEFDRFYVEREGQGIVNLFWAELVRRKSV